MRNTAGLVFHIITSAFFKASSTIWKKQKASEIREMCTCAVHSSTVGRNHVMHLSPDKHFTSLAISDWNG